ncbi:hypothetical protein OAL32_00290 [Synechococcus sp. AH-551-G15]|nr:hypothetical protein [Synechococcus sp. AH-551-G15]
MSFSKIDRLRKLVNEDNRVLTDPTSSEEDKRVALANKEARRRQQMHQNQQDAVTSLSPCEDMEKEMSQKGPASAHGHPTAPGGFQQFTSRTSRVAPRAFAKTHNNSNPGFSSPEVRPSAALYQEMTESEQQFVNSVVHALKVQAESQRLTKPQMLERWDAGNSDHTQAQLLVIGARLGALTEAYESTAGHWVVAMPYKTPTSAAEWVWNQQGITGDTADQVQAKQNASYGKKLLGYEEVYAQVPPARAERGRDTLEYSATPTQSNRSLKDPQRGSDFIRHSQLKQEQVEERLKELTKLSESKTPWVREKALKEMKKIKNELLSIKGQKALSAEKKQGQTGVSAVQQYAEGVTGLYNTHQSQEQVDEQVRYNYQRHLSLLDEAKRFLSSGEGAGFS